MSPLHAEVADALIVGIGVLLTFTVVGTDVDEQLFASVTVTVYEPELVTVIDCEVAEVDH